MKNMMIALALALTCTACTDGTLLAPSEVQAAPAIEKTTASSSAVPTQAAAAEPTDCQVIQPTTRRIIEEGPGFAVLRALADYDGEGTVDVIVTDFETGGPRGIYPLGDSTINLPPGVHRLRVDMEVQDNTKIYRCGGSVTAEVPSPVSSPSGGNAGGQFSGVPPQTETTIFTISTTEPGTFTAKVQWSLPSGMPAGYDAYLSTVRLRVYVNGALVREVSGVGRIGFVTKQTITAAVGPGEITLTACQMATAFDPTGVKQPFTFNVAVPILVESAIVQ